MQLLATINDSKQWRQVLASCQLEQLIKAENIKNRLATQSDTEVFCINEELSFEILIELLTQTNINIVLAFNAPEHVIGTLLEQGESLNKSLVIWLQQTESMLKLQQQHRQQLQLVQTEGLLINPIAAPKWLAIDLSLEKDQSILTLNHNIYYLMAAQALRQEPAAVRCLQRLIACSLPLLEQPEVHFNLDEFLQEYVFNKDQELAVITQELQSTHQQLKESNVDNESILKQLFYVQEELESVLLKNQRLIEENKLTQIEIATITSSRLWKIVAPVRKLKKVLLRRNRVSELMRRNIALIAGSEYFDEIWYLRNYPDVFEAGVNPAEHYLLFGALEGRAPGPIFDGCWYLSEYPDVADSDTNPLLHYVMFGAQEGRSATPKLLSDHQDTQAGE